jgi:hypothetical protein
MRKLKWWLGFLVGKKLMWRGVEEVHPTLYSSVGEVQKD